MPDRTASRALGSTGQFFDYSIPKGSAASFKLPAVTQPNRHAEMIAFQSTATPSDLQSEVACVGNFPIVLVLHALGSPEQRELIEPMIRGEVLCGFGLTEPEHGSDATWLSTTTTASYAAWS